MARVSVASADTAPVVAAPAGTVGDVESRALFGRPSDRIHLYLHRLRHDARIHFRGAPTDRLIYVWQGTVQAGGTTLEPRSSAIVEYGAALEVRAITADAAVLEFALQERTMQGRDGGHVHLLPADRVPRVEINEGKRVGMSLHANAACPTCELWLHENDFFDPNDETALHSHSEDEVMFVRDGAIRLGNRLCGPGTALAIAANTKYGFHSGPEGLSFVNFRGTSPTYRSADGKVVLDEAELWRTRVGMPVYLEPQALRQG